MRKFIMVISKLKYLGLLGLPMLFTDIGIFKYFWLFWLFAIVEVAFTLPILVQAFGQIFGMIIASFKYNPAPDKDNFVPTVLYSLPFNERWVAVNGGVVKAISHSWDIQAQRYAYDFIMMDNSAKSYTDKGLSVTDYYCYGKKILAPADGVVVEAKDNCKDSIIIGKGKTDPLIKDIRGNYIVIKHAENEYSVLAHLAPGSILVKKGQSVKRKEYIALCGNTGNTSEPHLHFQIQNGTSFFTSAGLPIHFENIAAESFPNYSQFDERPVQIESGINNTFISRGQGVANL